MDSQRLPITLQTPHVHLTKRTVWQLFGEGYKLTPAAPGDMPGRFLARERVRVTTPEGTERELPVIGPAAAGSRVYLPGAEGAVTLRGPAGEVILPVTPHRPHIHMPPEDASTLALLEGQEVTLATADGRRLEGVQVRVSHQYVTRIHLMAGENCPFTEEDLFHVEK